MLFSGMFFFIFPPSGASFSIVARIRDSAFKLRGASIREGSIHFSISEHHNQNLSASHRRQPSIRIIPFALVIANQPSCQFSIKQPWSVPILSRLNGNDLYVRGDGHGDEFRLSNGLRNSCSQKDGRDNQADDQQNTEYNQDTGSNIITATTGRYDPYQDGYEPHRPGGQGPVSDHKGAYPLERSKPRLWNCSALQMPLLH